jgi:hypothetical protein
LKITLLGGEDVPEPDEYGLQDDRGERLCVGCRAEIGFFYGVAIRLHAGRISSFHGEGHW